MSLTPVHLAHGGASLNIIGVPDDARLGAQGLADSSMGLAAAGAGALAGVVVGVVLGAMTLLLIYADIVKPISIL